MADWNPIRRAAREHRERLVPASEEIVHADEILAAALSESGLSAVPLPLSDPLLCGGHAVLDRDLETIWHRADLTAEETRFNVAHELAHWWLHDENAECAETDLSQEFNTSPIQLSPEYVAGYSPAQRREVEANVFAAEFLLPSSLVAGQFQSPSKDLSPTTIASSAGLDRALVTNQLVEALIPVSPSTSAGQSDAKSLSTFNLLNSLDESQRKAAEVESGPLLVSAGPGTGKTRTLVARASVLIQRGVRPEQILALTFSNKAADEMRERLALVDKAAASRIWIGTFHSFGLELLRRFGRKLELPPSPELVDRVDSIALLEKHLSRLELKEFEYLHDPTFPFGDLLSGISRAKDELVTPGQYAHAAEAMSKYAAEEADFLEASKAQEVAHVYNVWQAILQEEGRLDFGDLISRAVELLGGHHEVLSEVRSQYTHVLVDEYQDINRASAMLVRLIAGDGLGLWAVGDLRQAIYRFRGASAANIAQFERDYPNGKRLSLGVNYRSVSEIVDLLCSASREMAGLGEADKWNPARGTGSNCIVLAEADDEEAQADGLAISIRHQRREGYSLGDQCILVRTNAQAANISAYLEMRDIPVLFMGSLFERPEVKDLLAVISLFAEASPKALVRVARMPDYQLPKEEVRGLLRHAASHDGPFPKALEDFDTSYAGTLALRDHLAALSVSSDPLDFVSLYVFGLSQTIRASLFTSDTDAWQRRIALYQLLQIARAYSNKRRSDSDLGLAGFLNYVRRLAASGEDMKVSVPEIESIDAVRLLTVHKAKGLEFPVVYLPNLVKGQFPSRGRASQIKLPHGLVPEDSDDGSSEEECLFFVALSRARDKLILSRPAKLKGNACEPTPLFGLIDTALEQTGIESIQWKGSSEDVADSGKPPPPIATKQDDKSIFSIPELDQYSRCPRQYYYGRVCHLGDMDAISPYNAYVRCVNGTLNWLRSERAAGRLPTLEEAFGHLSSGWEEAGPIIGAQSSQLLTAAETAIKNALSYLETAGTTKKESEWILELPTGSIRVRPDHVEIGEDGRLILEDWRTGRPSDDDRKRPKLAVFRSAASSGASTKVEVRTRNLRTGEVTIAPEQPRWEPGRIEKYERAMVGINAKEFLAEPKEQGECARCAFYFICPTEAD